MTLAELLKLANLLFDGNLSALRDDLWRRSGDNHLTHKVRANCWEDWARLDAHLQREEAAHGA